MSLTLREIEEPVTESSVQGNGRVVRTHKHIYRAEADSSQSNMDVGSQLGFAPGDEHPDDPIARLRGLSIKGEKHIHPWHWRIELTYSTECPEPNASEDPLAEEVQLNWTTVRSSKWVMYDRDDHPILDSAGSPFDGGIEVPVARLQATFVRNEATFDSARALRYVNAVNSDTILGAEPGKLICQEMTAQSQNRQGRRYQQVTYVLEHEDAGWQPRILSAGFYQKIDGKRERIRDVDLQPVTYPVPLDADGLKIDPEDLPGGAHFLDFNLKVARAFRVLNLPQT